MSGRTHIQPPLFTVTLEPSLPTSYNGFVPSLPPILHQFSNTKIHRQKAQYYYYCYYKLKFCLSFLTMRHRCQVPPSWQNQPLQLQQ